MQNIKKTNTVSKPADNTRLEFFISSHEITKIESQIRNTVCFNRDLAPILFDAVNRNQPDLVKSMIDNGDDVNERNWSGETPLHIAAHHGFPDIVRILCQAGADVNIKNLNGETPLSYAYTYRNADTAGILIEHGADVNAVDADGNTPLILAASCYSNDIAGKLIQAGADVNHRNDSGETALFNAVGNGDYKIARLLLENGADPSIVNRQGDDALSYAVKSRQKGIAGLLIRHGANVNYINKRTGRTALMDACASGQLDIVQFLYDQKANPQLTDKSGRTALMISIVSENMEIAKFLIKKAGPCNRALLVAAEKGNTRLFNLLIQNGADVKEILCTLHDAISMNNECGEHIAEVMIKNNADISIMNSNGDTPLIAAIRNDYLKVVNLIASRKRGIDCTSKGLSALIIALKQKTLKSKKSAEILINNGASMNMRDKSGNSPLMLCIDNNYIDLAEKIIDSVESVNESNNYCATPLHKAAEKGDVKLIWKLLSKTGNIDSPDKYGNTPLTMCIEKVKDENALLLITRELIKRNADVNHKNSDGVTPLKIARMCNRKSVSDELVKAGAIDISYNSTSRDIKCEGGLPNGVV